MLQRLADNRLLVLRHDGHEVAMAHPFSAAPTDFVVNVGDRSWYANCASGQAFAILALLGDGSFGTTDPLDGTPLRWDVRNGQVEPGGVVHFAVPARDFWADIGFT